MMELDDLRRQWQQPPAHVPAPFDALALTQLLARQSDGIIAKLRRSARLELSINFGLVLGADIAQVNSSAYLPDSMGYSFEPVRWRARSVARRSGREMG